MATHSSVLAWRIPGTGEPGGLLSMGSQRVGLKRLSSSGSSTVNVYIFSHLSNANRKNEKANYFLDYSITKSNYN